jgi:metallo-beta-lactamase family protein
MIKTSFHGACREVTGACTLIETDNFKFLVDCGMFQGQSDSKEKNKEKFSFNPAEIDFVLLTHAHIDHCGRLPKLFKQGFKGNIYSTKATQDLAEIILLDSIKIQREEEKKPQYTEKDINKIVKNFKVFSYYQKININSNISIRMQDAGHILGSSIFEVWIKEKREENPSTSSGSMKKIIFSGDLGNPPAPIIKNPDFIEEGDILFIESTYGGRLHESKKEGVQIFKNIILDTIQKKSTLIMPVFAMERSQEVLYQLNHLIENKKIPRVPVYFDSPLAIKATHIYRKHRNLYDQEADKLISSGDDIFDFPNLRFTEDRNASMEINTARSPKIILASSGMCTGGRIPYHLKRYLDNSQNHVLIMSYQAQGTLGRELIEGAQNVIIHDKMVDVRAQITKISSFSTHSDHNQLLNWLNKITDLKKVFIMHGENLENKKLAEAINPNIETIIPEYDQKYSI